MTENIFVLFVFFFMLFVFLFFSYGNLFIQLSSFAKLINSFIQFHYLKFFSFFFFMQNFSAY